MHIDARHECVLVFIALQSNRLVRASIAADAAIAIITWQTHTHVHPRYTHHGPQLLFRWDMAQRAAWTDDRSYVARLQAVVESLSQTCPGDDGASEFARCQRCDPPH